MRRVDVAFYIHQFAGGAVRTKASRTSVS